MWWLLALVAIGGIVWLATRGVEEPTVPPPPTPEVFTCPVCGDSLTSQGELDAHMAVAHPITPTPEPAPTPTLPTPELPRVTISFEREPVCISERGGECLEYSDTERVAKITVTNSGAGDFFAIMCEGWFYKAGIKDVEITGTNRQFVGYLAEGETRTFPPIRYNVPVTGAPLDSRFHIKVYDRAKTKVIAEKMFTTSL